MEEPDTRIVSLEAKDKVSFTPNEDSVAAHWNGGKCDIVGKIALTVVRASDDLEVMSVQMERMLPGIEIVKHNVDNLVLLQHEGMRIYAINLRLRCVCAGGEDCKESGYFGSHVGNSIEESTSISQPLETY